MFFSVAIAMCAEKHAAARAMLIGWTELPGDHNMKLSQLDFFALLHVTFSMTMKVA